MSLEERRRKRKKLQSNRETITTVDLTEDGVTTVKIYEREAKAPKVSDLT